MWGWRLANGRADRRVKFYSTENFRNVGQTPDCLMLIYELKLARAYMLNRLLLGFCKGITGNGVKRNVLCIRWES